MGKKSVATAEGQLEGKPELKTAIQVDDFSDMTPDYDPAEFGAFLRYMKGTRSAREFAIDAGLSESFISKALNGFQKSRPSKRTLMKLMRVKTEETIDRMKLISAAGYRKGELETELPAEPADPAKLSTAAIINRYYGGDNFTAMGELMKALSEHGLDGDITGNLYRQNGYYEIIDKKTEQVYVGINAYLRAVTGESEGETTNEADKELQAIIAIAFSAGLTYRRVIDQEGAGEKIVYIQTDNERIYNALRNNLPGNKTKATVVVLTDDHQGFCKESILSGSENTPISLVD